MLQTQEKTTQPNQQHNGEGLMYVNYQLPRVLTLEELKKTIQYLTDIKQYAEHNNINMFGFHS